MSLCLTCCELYSDPCGLSNGSPGKPPVQISPVLGGFLLSSLAVTTHMCEGLEVDGPVKDCEVGGVHGQKYVAAADVRPYDDRRTRLRVAGIAKTGQISNKGTVKHLDYWSGRMAAKVAPASPAHQKMFDLPWFREQFEYRDGKLYEKATGKECEWTKQGSTRSGASSSKRKLTEPSQGNSVNGSRGAAASTEKLIVARSLTASNRQQ